MFTCGLRGACLIGAVLLFALPAIAQPTMKAIDLGTLGGLEGGDVFAINDHGQVVGSSSREGQRLYPAQGPLQLAALRERSAQEP